MSHSPQRDAPYAAEVAAAGKTGNYARALRLLAKRRLSISYAEPYLAATVASTQAYVYCNGTLVYYRNRNKHRTLHILDLHGASDTEIVVDIRALLDKAVHESRGTASYKFVPVHYANGIVTCRYTHDKSIPASWLVVFSLREHWTLSHPLESVYKLFARNNERHLCFGTYSHREEDGHRRWALRTCNLETQTWDAPKIILMDMAGSDLGSTISFEIYDNFFYGLSNMETFDADGTDYSSYYYCFRFPLGHATRSQIPSKASLWRRKNAEGALDDRFTSLQLTKDVATGRLSIVESRKEWLVGKSGARRTYYTMSLRFPGEKEDGGGGNDASSSIHKGDQPIADTAAATTGGMTSNDSSSSHQNDEPDGNISVTAGPAKKPAKLGPLSRSPHDVHIGDKSSAILLHTDSKTIIRSYHPECSTFVDVVDDHPADDPGTQRIRIRAGPRRLKPLDSQGVAGPVADAKYPEEDIERLYRGGSVTYWPPEAGPDRSEPWLDRLSLMLNPPTHPGYSGGTSDDRSVLIATGPGKGALRRLIFISFDPSIRFSGVSPARGMAQGTAPQDGPTGDRGEPEMSTVAGKGKEEAQWGYPTSGGGTCTSAEAGDWISREPAWYRSMADGIDFSF